MQDERRVWVSYDGDNYIKFSQALGYRWTIEGADGSGIIFTE